MILKNHDYDIRSDCAPAILTQNFVKTETRLNSLNVLNVITKNVLGDQDEITKQMFQE